MAPHVFQENHRRPRPCDPQRLPDRALGVGDRAQAQVERHRVEAPVRKGKPLGG
jgi:hypothetical protein